jgi:uncharacterized repeat protein (TIGR01451 family)
MLVLVCGLATGLCVTTIPVTNTDDTGPDTPAPNSLRAALAAASDGDTIDATGISGAITLVPGLISSAQLVVDKSVTILGPGPANLTVDANHLSRVFHITPGHTVTINGLTIANGLASGTSPADLGGGIYNDHSNLALNNSTISSNSAEGHGGGIYNDGSNSSSATLNVVNCTLGGNSAASDGGGIYNDGEAGSATLTIVNSTLSENSASLGGAIENFGLTGSAPAEVANSTLSGNTAGINGGGIANFTATLQIANSTLSGNSAEGSGGGILNFGFAADAPLRIVNSTLCGNSAVFHGSSLDNREATLEIGNTILKGVPPAENISSSGRVTSHGFNVCSDGGVFNYNGGTGNLDANGDQLDTDPKLGPLADNGGPTLTHLPSADSPAIDRGSSDTLVAFGITTDQRGLPRTVDDPNISNAFLGDGTDIGAIEAGIPPAPNHPPVAVCKNVTVLADASGTASASINDGSYDPDPGDTITPVQTPPGPYAIGATTVTLTVTDNHGDSSSCTATVTVQGVADLAVSQTVSSGQAKPGQVLTYTIVVSNLGPNPASGVMVNDAVPQGTTFVSASPAPSSAPGVGAAGTITWNLGNLASGASVKLTLTVKVSIKGNNLVMNTATVTSSSSDPNPANNTATVTSKRKTK